MKSPKSEDIIAGVLLRSGNWSEVLKLVTVVTVYRGWWWNRHPVGYRAIVDCYAGVPAYSSIQDSPFEAVVDAVRLAFGQDDLYSLEFLPPLEESVLCPPLP